MPLITANVDKVMANTIGRMIYNLISYGEPSINKKIYN